MTDCAIGTLDRANSGIDTLWCDEASGSLFEIDALSSGLQSTQVVFTLISVLELKPRFGHAIMDVWQQKSEFPIFISTSVVQLCVGDLDNAVWVNLSEQQTEDFGISDYLLFCHPTRLLVDQFDLEAFIFMPRNVVVLYPNDHNGELGALLKSAHIELSFRFQWFASKDNLWLPFQLLSASFYTNSFLASLNSRSMVRQRGFSDGVNTSAELALTDLRKI
ncbi:hypothetical protein EYR38_010655 [Pleurotus pulmonarius]|nr:hypothetical protein EYR38_010655 [Pleurotus pulmonarius]